MTGLRRRLGSKDGLRRYRFAPLLALGLMEGCRPCSSFDDMEVTDPDGVAIDGELDLIRSVVSDFAAGTGREGVCVPEIQMRPVGDPLLSEFVGAYIGEHEPIYVQAGLSDIDRVARHELCHAIDGTENLSVGRDDLFPPESVPQDAYTTQEIRTGEAFARACAEGSLGVALRRVAFDACDIQPDAETESYVMAEVYDQVADAVPTVSVSIDRYPDDRGLPDDATVAARGVFGAKAISVAEFLGDDHLTYTSDPVVYRVDLESGQTEGVSLPVDVHDRSNVSWALFSGDERIVAFDGREPGTFWNIDFDDGYATRIDGLPSVSGQAFGVVLDDKVWFGDAGVDARLHSWDLALGTGQDVPWPTTTQSLAVQVAGWATAGGQVLGASSRRGLLSLSVDTADWSVISGPDSTELQGTTVDADRWLATAISMSTYDAFDADLTPLLLYDLEAGEWVLPDDPCGVGVTSEPEPLSNGSEAWVWDWGAEPGLYSGKYFGRVRIGG